MKHVCAAYFPKSPEEFEQGIDEHIINGIDFIEEVFLDRRFDTYLVRLAHSLKVEISERESRNALYASYIFHDLGKISRNYQESKSSFGGHEIISAYWISIHGNQLGLGEMLYPVMFSIYLHHHDIRKNSFKEVKRVNLCESCLNLILDMYKKKTSIDLTTYKTELVGEIHSKLRDKFYQVISNDREFKYFRLSYPLLQVIHGADNYSASIRRGKQTILSDEIQKVYKAIRFLREIFGRFD
jgi:CRISPR/Cas system-associated endonuclease Cas3-HD